MCEPTFEFQIQTLCCAVLMRVQIQHSARCAETCKIHFRTLRVGLSRTCHSALGGQRGPTHQECSSRGRTPHCRRGGLTPRQNQYHRTAPRHAPLQRHATPRHPSSHLHPHTTTLFFAPPPPATNRRDDVSPQAVGTSSLQPSGGRGPNLLHPVPSALCAFDPQTAWTRSRVRCPRESALTDHVGCFARELTFRQVEAPRGTPRGAARSSSLRAGCVPGVLSSGRAEPRWSCW